MSTIAATDPYAAINAANTATSGTTTTTKSTATDASSADRFLKLLVTQLQNQDPLNPMDNAQVTSQMAQISTVSGIQQLNSSVSGLNTQFVQMQALQGVSLIGREVTVPGKRLDIAGGSGAGGFDLDSAADSVTVQIMNEAGSVVDTVDLGAQSAGTHSFDWDATGVADGSAYRFQVVATAGAAAVTATPLMHDRVAAVSTSASGLVLQTQYSGNLAYSDIRAFN
jgi:flagellar basal-body rod modification protein FlgD